MIEVEIVNISPSDFKEKLIDFASQGHCNLKTDIDGDVTHEVKEWEDDGYGYSSWSYDDVSYKAWYNFNDAVVTDHSLIIGVIGQKHLMLKNVYAFYHTELPRIILTYFDEYVENIKITSQPIENVDQLHNNAKYQG